MYGPAAECDSICLYLLHFARRGRHPMAPGSEPLAAGSFSRALVSIGYVVGSSTEPPPGVANLGGGFFFLLN
jgi:hypothetical protein